MARAFDAMHSRCYICGLNPRFFLRFLRFLTILLLLAPGLAHAGCEPSLDKQILSLPKELRLKPDALSYLFSQPLDRKLLESLSRIFNFATTENLELVSSWLRGTVDENSLEEFRNNESSFFAEFPNFASVDTERNYILLKRNFDLIESDLNDYDKSLLAVLLEKASKRIRIKPSDVNAVEPAVNRFNLAFKKEKYQKAISITMDSAKAKQDFHKDWDKRKEIYGLPDFELQWTLTRAQMSMNQLDAEAKKMLRVYFIHVFGMLHEGALNLGDSDSKYEFAIYSENIEKFLAHDLQVPSSIQDITDLLLYTIYDVPLPSTPPELRQIMIDGANRALGASKGRFAKYSSKQNQQKSSPSEVAPFELKLVDFFAPQQSVTFRNKTKNQNALALSEKPSLSITPALALKRFSRYVPQPHPITELQDRTRYQFVYLRETEQSVETIEFSRDAIDWLHSHEGAARQILDALNMGRARAFRQNGIKILFKRSPHFDGPVFEIKNASGFRPLMIKGDGAWQVLTIVDHDDVDRAIENLKPLSK